MKVCNVCKEAKDFPEFNKRSNAKDGLQSFCRPCGNRMTREAAESRKVNGPTVIRDSKVCVRCSTKKPIGQFYVKRGHSADGYGSHCKPCWVIITTASQKKARAKK